MKTNKGRKPQMKRMVYSVAEVASLLDINLAAAYELARSRNFPSIKVSPRRIVIPKQAFHRWLDNAAQDGHSSGMA